MGKIIKTGAKLIVTDFNMLPSKIEESWIFDFTDNFLIFDKANRFQENEKVRHQKNVGANIYDIFDFIFSNYENLPEIMIFCKANVTPRHCGISKFIEIVNETKFTPIENYVREAPPFSPGIYAYVDESDGYHEDEREVDGVVRNIHHSKYIFSYRDLLCSIFENPTFDRYIRFAPGGNYIICKKDILRYNRIFYETMREYVSWDVKPGEAYLLERAIFTIFNNSFSINEKFRN